MYSHTVVGSNDIEKSRKFYDATFGAIGADKGQKDDKGRLIYQHNDGLFLVTEPIDGQPATHANGGTIGFAMNSLDEVKAWHDAGVEAGGSSIEDPPGLREDPAYGKLNLAYLRDPDGNKLCALHRPE